MDYELTINNYLTEKNIIPIAYSSYETIINDIYDNLGANGILELMDRIYLKGRNYK